MMDIRVDMNKLTDDIFFCKETGKLSRGDNEMTLSEKERVLFSAFVARKNVNISKDEIIRAVWGGRSVVTPETNLTQLIYRLRRSLHAVGLDSCIRTVPRTGYAFIIEEAEHIPCTADNDGREKNKRGLIARFLSLKSLSAMILCLSVISPSTSNIDNYSILQRRTTDTNIFQVTLSAENASYVEEDKVLKVTVEVDTSSGSYVYNFSPRSGETFFKKTF